ncbi:MAG: fibronectin type III domain-containing protein [Pyrinomonadaceae bacterium]|nr:fibronectin type III domain-containing protein [Pyrinomonadaceae bacterium]
MERIIGSTDVVVVRKSTVNDPVSTSRRSISGRQRRLALTVGRLLVIALVALAVSGAVRTELLVPLLSTLTASAAARDRTPPTAPSNLRVTGNTTSSVSLAWNASTDNSGSLSYRIRHSGGYSATAPQSQTSFTWTSNINAGQTYSFYVYAVDASGNQSRNSNAVTVTFPSETLPPPQPVVSVTDIGPTHISLSWASTGGSTLRYWVFMDGALNRQPTPETSGTFYLLDPETSHTFTVQARVGTNASPQSDLITITTEPINPNDTTAPTMPANLWQQHWAGDPEIYLSWDRSADDLDPQSIIRYNVYVNGVLDDIRVGTNRTSVYVVPGLNTINVVAVDTAGNESAQASITFVYF